VIDDPTQWEFLTLEGVSAFAEKDLLRELRPQLEGFRDQGESGYADDAIYLLERYYRENGYHFVEAMFRVTDVKPARLLIRVNEGPRVFLEKVRIHGKKKIQDSDLNPIMNRVFLRVFGEVFVANRTDEQIGRIFDYYHRQGYINARMVNQEIRFSEDRTQAQVHIWVEEGEQYLLSKIKFRGNATIPTDELLELIGNPIGRPYRPGFERKLAARVEAVYRDRGHLRVSAEGVWSVTLRGNNVHVSIAVTEGPKVNVEWVEIRSRTESTENWVIRRLVDIEAGELYSRSKILDAQKRLLDTNLFRHATLTTEDVRPDAVRLVVNLDEESPGFATVRGGYGSYERARFGLDLGYRNLFGTARSVELNNKVSSIGYRTALQYKNPWHFGLPVEFRNHIWVESREEVAFEFDGVGTSFSYTYRLLENLNTSLGYGWENMDVTKVEDPTLKVEEGEVRDRNLFANLVYDTRDNPFHPKGGLVVNGTVTYGGHFLKGNIDYTSFDVSAATYFDLGSDWIVAVGAGGGSIQPQKGTEFVPISKRFFLGGERTVRGWDQDELGPESAGGTPEGGESFVRVNGELRFPMFMDGLYGVLFYDGGQVFREWEDTSGGDLDWGYGGGIRYLTPLGPFRFEYGRQVDPPRGRDDIDAFYFSVGYPF
jgi:outer membrane protein insertion porin family